MLVSRVCQGSQLLLIFLYYIYSQVYVQSSGENQIACLYLPDFCGCPGMPGKCADALLLVFPRNQSVVPELGLLGWKLFPSFLGRISTQMPVSATIWHPSYVFCIYRMNKTIDKWVNADECGPKDQGQWMCVYLLENKGSFELKKKDRWTNY